MKVKPKYTLTYELYGVRNVTKFPTTSAYGNFTSIMEENEFTKDSFEVISIKEKRKPVIWRWWYRHWGYKNF